MHKARPALYFSSVLLLACLFLQPIGVAAQCMTASTSMGTGTQGGMNYRYGAKILSGTYQCNLTMQMQMIGCDPDPSASTTFLSGAAFTTATSPTCEWSCTCGNVTITQVDLPVELMDFGIDGGELEIEESADDPAAGHDSE